MSLNYGLSDAKTLVSTQKDLSVEIYFWHFENPQVFDPSDW